MAASINRRVEVRRDNSKFCDHLFNGLILESRSYLRYSWSSKLVLVVRHSSKTLVAKNGIVGDVSQTTGSNKDEKALV